MKARVVILPDGKVSFYVDEGSYEQASAKLQAVLTALGAAGVTFAETGQIEQHRHAHEHAENHVHDHTH